MLRNAKEKQTPQDMNLPTIDQINAERKRMQNKADYRKALFGTIDVLILVAAVAVLISTLFLPVLQVTGDSMEPTLEHRDIVVLLKSRNYEAGEICSFSWNNKTLVKRVIGVPGDWIEIDEDGTVYVNGEALDEPYITDKSLGECDLTFPYQVPDHSLFLMGDHRETSIDSRNSVIGSVDYAQIIGKVKFRVWPFRDLGSVK